MSRKIIYHAVKEVHVTKRRKAAKVGKVKSYGYYVNEPDVDTTLCGYRVGKNRGYYSGRISEVHAAKRCARTVTCKRCLNRVEFKKANPNIKPKEVNGTASLIRST